MAGDIFAKDNYYDKYGNLLLAKGQVITQSTMERLERLGASTYKAENDNIDSTIYNDVKIDNRYNINTFKEKLNLRNMQILDNSTDILNDVLYKSKEKKWDFLKNALANYLDWLYTHTIDVCLLSLMLGIELGYTKKQLDDLCIGSFFHDVGKLAIPKSILVKTDKLNDMERTYIKQHCEIGHSAMNQYDCPNVSAQIILQHHERLDGSGYPAGLCENKICDGAKIVMVADTADAITSYRPYRSTQNIDTAISILSSHDTLFPKDIVDSLKKILG